MKCPSLLFLAPIFMLLRFGVLPSSSTTHLSTNSKVFASSNDVSERSRGHNSILPCSMIAPSVVPKPEGKLQMTTCLFCPLRWNTRKLCCFRGTQKENVSSDSYVSSFYPRKNRKNHNVFYKRGARTSEAPTPLSLRTYSSVHLNHVKRQHIYINTVD